jgi:hypothetical protein
VALHARHPLLGLLLVLTSVATGACKSKAPDVLKEFPPPRLAKLSPHLEAEPRVLLAQCKGDLMLRTRLGSKTLKLDDARGTFELVSLGNSDVNATLDVALPKILAADQTQRAGPLAWRIVGMRPAAYDDGPVPVWGGSKGGMREQDRLQRTVVAELEYNRVRTRVVHSIEFERLDGSDVFPTAVHLWRLALDPRAHRLEFPAQQLALTNGRPVTRGDTSLKSAELNLDCTLTE